MDQYSPIAGFGTLKKQLDNSDARHCRAMGQQR
jgi:hypothetical protein